eukprot:CAMPEP_0194049506 /NCGR_PEP_ID=MMETSP0009_2-20130614/30719_1 /TAXON_ID=210454 /ORGANISM="Grammatophora oceanica, Strain CCMP 410" /LENGTH=410 /DNA_ID=CAMNT_0038695681 /DNA_START=21 /DNA_END=1256 /DNA_ORIENTATION=-
MRRQLSGMILRRVLWVWSATACLLLQCSRANGDGPNQGAAVIKGIADHFTGQDVVQGIRTDRQLQAEDSNVIEIEPFLLEYDAGGTPAAEHYDELAIATADYVYRELYEFYDDNFVGFDIDHIEPVTSHELWLHGEARFSDEGPSKNSINMHIKSIFAIGHAYREYIGDVLDETNPFAASSGIEYAEADYGYDPNIGDEFDSDEEDEEDIEEHVTDPELMNHEDEADVEEHTTGTKDELDDEHTAYNEGDVEEVIYTPKNASPIETEHLKKKTSNLVYGLAYSFAMMGSALLTIFALVMHQQARVRREKYGEKGEKWEDGCMSALGKARTVAGSTLSDITPSSPKSPKAYSEMDRGNDEEADATEKKRLMVEDTLDWPNGPFEPVSPDDPRLDDISTSDDTTIESLILNI